ncbi:acid phosphatase 1-like isoform X2 [Musa acuminata AAA Group]|uniref:acid phosphatase 1-like isoform X2 n=1 Tax=Musa acuminata AAA Group TaxID=214697 RepID=UPI0031CE0CCA
MGPFRFLLLFFFLGVVAAESPQTILRTTTQAVAASAFAYDHLYCDSWRLSVETNNARFWRTVPFRCSEFVQEYMSGARYASDTDIVVDESLAFARSVQIANDGNDAWIFDVDETLLSNVPYYAINGFGEDSDMGKPAVVFKSGRRAELEGQGFRILASSGDQWSDLLGFPMAQRSFKHPNPMYYIG